MKHKDQLYLSHYSDAENIASEYASITFFQILWQLLQQHFHNLRLKLTEIHKRYRLY